MSADFFHITDVGRLQLLAVRNLQALADGMAGIALRICSILKQFILCEIPAGVNTRHIEYTLGQGTGLVKYYIFCPGQSFQIVGSFDQNTGIAGSTDSCEET